MFSERESMDNLEKLALVKPEKCEKCQGGLEYLGLGCYKCIECGNEMLDNYGKIKKYYQEHGQAPVFQVARETGISREHIHIILDGGGARRWGEPEQQSVSRSHSFSTGYDRMHFLK